jgi:hypothetical protein
MSPREMSISSSSSSVTDCSATARGRERPPIWMPLDAAAALGGQYHDFVADGNLARFDAPHEATVVVQQGIVGLLRAADILHREAEALVAFAVRGG